MSLTKMNAYADLLDASNVGYDQYERFSFNPARDGLTVIPNRECDCSSSCAAIAKAGGFSVDMRDPIYTGNFKNKLIEAGFAALDVRGWSQSKLYAAVSEGDFLLGPGHVVYIRERNRWWSAENDERGRSTGGKAGDQTGMEARYRNPYMRSRGWEWILRPVIVADPLVAVTPPPAVDTVTPLKPNQIEWRNPSTDFVRIVQRIVGVNPTGYYGTVTKRRVSALQAKLGVEVDDLFGAGTAEAYLLSQPNMHVGSSGLHEPAVMLLQWIVRSKVDGVFGPLTEADLKQAQAWAGLTPDGNAGADTKRAITF